MVSFAALVILEQMRFSRVLHGQAACLDRRHGRTFGVQLKVSQSLQSWVICLLPLELLRSRSAR